MIADTQVAWYPSYGPEMRGGTANCNVTISDEVVASPVVVEATTALVLNSPSLDKFEANVMPNGKLFINSSLITKKATRDDIEVFYVPANEIANELGNNRVANMVMLGAFIEAAKPVEMESLYEAFLEVFGTNKSHLLPINKEALARGAMSVRV